MASYTTSAEFLAIDSISGVVGAIGQNISAMGDHVSGVLDGMGGAFGALAGPVGGMFDVLAQGAMIGVQHLLDVDEAIGTMGARTGASTEELAKYKKETDDLFNSGLVKNYKDAADAVEQAHTQIKGLQEADFTKFIITSAAVAKAWGQDPGSLNDNIGKIEGKFKDLNDKPGYVLDLIVTMAQKTGDPLQQMQDELLGVGGKFAAAGLSGTVSAGLIVAAHNAAITNMAQVGTLVDTFRNNMANPTPAFTKALADLGLQGVVADVKSGKKDIGDALDEVFGAFKTGVKDGVDPATIQVGVFGKASLKIGDTNQLGQLAGFSKAFYGSDNSVGGAAEKVGAAMDNLASTGLQKVTNGLSSLMGGVLETAATAFLQLPVVLGAIVTQAAATATNIVNGVKGIIDGLGGIFANAFLDVKYRVQIGWGIISNWLSTGINAVVKFFQDMWASIVSAINGAAAGVSAAFHSVFDPIVGILQPILDLINKILGGLGAVNGSTLPSNWTAPPSQQGPHKNAAGGFLDPGWNMVGELGPEMVFSGKNGQVLTANQTRTVLGSGGGGGGGNTNITVNTDGATIIDLQTFIKTVYKQLQYEDQRRGKR